MTNYNALFAAIKKFCGEPGQIEEKERFDSILKEAGIPKDRTHFYLDCLQELDLIEYSYKDKYIRLTQPGKEKNMLFSI